MAPLTMALLTYYGTTYLLWRPTTTRFPPWHHSPLCTTQCGQARRVAALQAEARRAAAELEAFHGTEEAARNLARQQSAALDLARTQVESLTARLEAARSEAAEMQARLQGFDGVRRALEARCLSR